MNGWLLDTNVVSELRRPKPAPKVLNFVAVLPLEMLFVSSVTIAEIRFGIETVESAVRRAELQAWLTQKVRPMFEGRVLPVSEDVILEWRLRIAEARKERYTYTQPDLLIAATALHYDLTVLSRDVVEFRRARARVVNPWE